MSNFLMGVVRRGAGLAMPVTVRPARGPEQVPAAMPSMAETREGNLMDTRLVSEGSDIPTKSETIPQNTMRPEPRYETAFVTQDSIAPRSTQTEAHVPVQPRVEIGGPELTEKVEKRGASEPSAAVEPSRVERDPAEATIAISPVQDTPQSANEQRASQIQPVIPCANEMPTPVEHKPSPRQERQAMPQSPLRRESARASNAGPAAQAAAPEKKTINVKIGRVEIRSAQPAPVVQRPRANSNSGFEDARLSRLYLDRNMR